MAYNDPPSFNYEQHLHASTSRTPRARATAGEDLAYHDGYADGYADRETDDYLEAYNAGRAAQELDDFLLLSSHDEKKVVEVAKGDRKLVAQWILNSGQGDDEEPKDPVLKVRQTLRTPMLGTTRHDLYDARYDHTLDETERVTFEEYCAYCKGYVDSRYDLEDAEKEAKRIGIDVPTYYRRIWDKQSREREEALRKSSEYAKTFSEEDRIEKAHQEAHKEDPDNVVPPESIKPREERAKEAAEHKEAYTSFVASLPDPPYGGPAGFAGDLGDRYEGDQHEPTDTPHTKADPVGDGLVNYILDNDLKDPVLREIRRKYYQGVEARANKATTTESTDPKCDTAVKNDEGKARFDLIPADALYALAELYARGAKKYTPNNWRKGMDYGRLFAAMQRHAWAWWEGEEHDMDDGQHHLTSVAWCAFALYHLQATGKGRDDRNGAQC